MAAKFLTATQVREMFGGICEMTLWRWRHAVPPAPAFPKPIRLHGRNYFPADAVDDWVHAQANAAAISTAIPDADHGRSKGLFVIATAKPSKSTMRGNGEMPP
jgi:predicted DNA-binding transcriptional regulator AlpA